MGREHGSGMGRMGDEGVGVRVRGFVHAYVPVRLRTGYVSVGHGWRCGRREGAQRKRTCVGDEEGKGKLSKGGGW